MDLPLLQQLSQALAPELVETIGNVEPDEPARLESLRSQVASEGLPFYEISSVTNKGTKELVAAIAAKLDELTESTRQASVVELAL